MNHRRESVQGVQAYPDVAALPKTPDLVVICTPAPTVPGIVKQCGEAGILGLLILSAGFREAGEAGRNLEKELQETLAQFDGMRLIGPNCLGVIVPRIGLNASFAASTPGVGNVSFVSQSGALCTSVLDWAEKEGIGFSHFVSIGNALDVGFADLIDYFGDDPQTHSMLFYMESLARARHFMSAARAFSKKKPIVAYKSGRFAESASAAASHTGAMAGEDAVYDAAFRRAGIERVFSIEDLFDCAELLARQRLPKGNRLAILTNAGGPGVMATDALMELQGKLAQLSDDTIRQLNEFLPPHWSHGNPVDVLGDARADRFAQAAKVVLADKNVDALLVMLTPQAMTEPTAKAQALAQQAAKTTKPLLASWMGGRAVEAGVEVFNQAGIPTYATPEQAIRAFMHLGSYAHNLELLYETPRDVPLTFSVDRERVQELFQATAAAGHETLSEDHSKTLLQLYGLPVVSVVAAHTPDEAVEQAKNLGFPVVLKILSPQITHKTDVGGVVLNLANEDQVRRAYDQIVSAAQRARPDARIEGVTVQRMISGRSGLELILGMKKDPTFGSVILVGLGGITAELFHDRALGLPPLNERLAMRMLQSLKSWPLLAGYRGRPGVNLELLVEILMHFSYLVVDCPQIAELDVNPLLVTEEGLIALDARVILDRQALANPPRRAGHLAISPYPEEYIHHTTASDGTPLTLRPIKPEDEALWHQLVSECSSESLWFRFRYLFKSSTHEMATRFCYLDYDRELAIVAETVENGQRKLLGVGRLVASPDRTSAEYAVLVIDRCQGRGLGSLLTDYCLDIAHRWRISRVFAETTPDNNRMMAVFRNRGFTVKSDLQGGVVLVEKLLTPVSEGSTND